MLDLGDYTTMMSTNRQSYSFETNAWGYTWLLLGGVNIVNLIGVISAIFLSRFGLYEFWRTTALGLGLYVAFQEFNKSLNKSGFSS